MRNRSEVSRSMLRISVLLAAVLLPAMTGFAQTVPKPVSSTAAQRGKQTFLQSCAVCHGERANGKGSAASALTPRPTDLTVLSKRTDASPAQIVEGAIRGTSPVVAHGSPGMQVWGAVFLADANGNQALADARIEDLVRFIESIQVKPRITTP